MAGGVTEARGARLGMAGCLLTCVVAGIAGWIALSTGSFLAAGAAVHLSVSSWVWLALLMLERLHQRAAREEIETRRLTALAHEGRRSLFEGDATTGEAARALARFRRVAYPVFTLLVAASGALGVWWLAVNRPVAPADLAPSLAAAAVLCGAAFALLLQGRYAFAISRSGHPAAASGGRRAISGAAVTFLAGLGLAAHHSWGLAQADLLGYVLLVMEGLLSLEALVLLLLEVYRPRREGEEDRPPYDSRLLGLLSAPSDLARSVARAVDYQFGFALSQTWLYRFLERWIAPLAGFTAVAFWLLSSLSVIHPHEEGILRRVGIAQEGALQPGLHLKLPWPIDHVEAVPTRRMQTFVTGRHGASDDHGDSPEIREPSLLWTEGEHVDPDGMGSASLVLLARSLEDQGEASVTPVNLLVASANVHYQIDDPDRFVRNVAEPEEILEVLAERELSFLLSGEDLDALLRQRGRHAAELQRRLQAATNGFELGVLILGTPLTDLHPPIEVGAAFEAVTVAQERSLATILEARAHAARIGPRSRVEASNIALAARIKAASQLGLAKAEAHRFDALRALDRAAPGVFRMTRLLDTFTAGAAGKRKVIVGTRSKLVTDLDLQEKVSVEAMGLGEEYEQGETCVKCGAPLARDAEVCPRCATPVERKK